jgi:hypothetical protein
MYLTAYGKAWFLRLRKQGILITHQTLLVMKMTAFLLFIVCMQVSAKTQGQISLSEKKAPLDKAAMRFSTTPPSCKKRILSISKYKMYRSTRHSLSYSKTSR